MLVNLKEILEIAERDNIAIGMFNATGFDSLQAIIAAAEELNQPVIIAHAEVHNVYNDISIVGPAIIAAAQNTPPRWHEFSGETFRGIKLTAVINALLRDEDFDNYLDRSQVPHSKHLSSMRHLLATRGII